MAARNVPQKDTFCCYTFEYISEPVLNYFYLSKEGESALLPALFSYTSICTNNAYTFATTVYLCLHTDSQMLNMVIWTRDSIIARIPE